MGCEPFELKDGSRGFICSRSAPRQRCSVCGKLGHARLCDFVIAAAGSPTKAGTPRRRTMTCDAKLCPNCAVHVGPDRDICPAHARFVAGANVPPSLLADPSPFAMQVVADHVEQAMKLSEPSRSEPSRLSVASSSVFELEPVVPQEKPFRARDRADWLEYYTERAAIAEYLGGASRVQAEWLARELAGRQPR